MTRKQSIAAPIIITLALATVVAAFFPWASLFSCGPDVSADYGIVQEVSVRTGSWNSADVQVVKTDKRILTLRKYGADINEWVPDIDRSKRLFKVSNKCGDRWEMR